MELDSMSPYPPSIMTMNRPKRTCQNDSCENEVDPGSIHRDDRGRVYCSPGCKRDQQDVEIATEMAERFDLDATHAENP